MIAKKKLIFCAGIVLVLILIPLVYAGNYGALKYNSGVYGIGEVPVTPTPAPVQDTSSGGGGPTCNYDWQCTNWFPEECPESGIQERVCANKGDCTGITGTPSENQTCEYTGPTEPLFDIYLTLPLGYNKLCSGDEIKANIKLENYGKVELLDAFMTYWIIDENNKLIVELKDTRAVENEKEFEIELRIPESASGGNYYLYAQINYDGNKTAVAGESFELRSKENCSFYYRVSSTCSGYYSSIKDYLLENKKFIEYLGIFIILLFIVWILVKLSKVRLKVVNKKERGVKTHTEYKMKIKHNLSKIKSKKLLMIVLGFMIIGILFTAGNNLSGLVTKDLNVAHNWGFFWVILVASFFGLLIFACKKEIVEKVEMRKRNKYSKNSLRGLIKKKVYSEKGDYFGKVEEVFLWKNRVDSLKIKLSKKQEFKIQGIVIKYNEVKNVGHIVIIGDDVLEHLDKSGHKKYKNAKPFKIK